MDDTTKKNKKAKVGLPWEPSSYYSQEVPERDDEEDEEEEEMNFITLQRLRKADERTKAMTKEEYVTWSEYRQASFTYRKGKRFREWAGFGIVTDSKPSDDIVDILGFLTFEMVQTLTENALRVKEQEDLVKANNGGGGSADGEGASKKRKLQQGLFDPPSEGKTPIEPRHVQEAFRRLQARSKKSRAMLIGTRLPQHTTLNIVSCFRPSRDTASQVVVLIYVTVLILLYSFLGTLLFSAPLFGWVLQGLENAGIPLDYIARTDWR